jgi:hypothetical protein
VEPDELGPTDVVLTVRSDGALVPISPWVYGINGNANFAELRHGLVRHAGQRWSAYNWENNASNAGAADMAGADYEYQNDSFLAESDTPGAAVLEPLQAAEAAQTATLLSVAILDDVAADKLADGDVRNSGTDWLVQRFEKNHPQNPAGATTTPDRSDDAVYQDDFVLWARSGFEGTDVLFCLDTTPDLWRRFHPTLHPDPVSYEELVDRTIRFATAVKAIWPAAPVVGYGSFGWSGWEWLADPVTGDAAPDSEGKGAFVDYWLQALSSAEAVAGQRLIDFVDLHWHPEASANGVRILEDDNSPEVAEARVQAPRSLWDVTFVEDSWITDVAIPGEPISWLPRTLERIEQFYPGTRLAIGEWGFGGENHISGALATADALGWFGRYGVGLAAHTGEPGPFTLAAFAAFRNFDGEGARFGDTALTTVTDDIVRTSVHAAVDWADQNRLVVIAINRSQDPLITGLCIAHPTRFTRADTWVLDATAAAVRPSQALSAAGTNAFQFTLPAQSVLVIVPTSDPA